MLFGITQNEITIFLLVFARITSALMVFPIFGSTSYPAQTKIGLCILLSVLTVPLLSSTQISAPPAITILLLDIGKEVLVGLVLGFCASILFAGIELAGHLIAIQIGFAMVNVIDPQSEHQVTVIAQVKILVATMIFIALDGHHFLINGLYESFKAVPLLSAHFPNQVYELNMKMGAGVFISAVKIGAPVIATLLLTSVALGLIARAVPQMNVFFVAFPLKIGLGLAALSLSLPFFAYVFRLSFLDFRENFFTVLHLVGR